MMNRRKISTALRQLPYAALCTIVMLGANVLIADAQQYVPVKKYEVNKNTHSHNDYLQSQPFYTAHASHFASMEIDVFLEGNELYVAHTKEDIDKKRTIESLYLEPLLREIKLNGNNQAYKDEGKLQFLIDLKTTGEPALKCLEAKLKPLRRYFDLAGNPDAVRLVITGNVPAPDRFKAFDPIFFFDGKRGTDYSADQLKRVAFFSVGLHEFTRWNGLGRMVEADYNKSQNFVDSVHQVGKQVRFWGNPDTKTCWQAFIKMGEKTNNRYIGMDVKGEKIPDLPEMLAKKGIRSGIVSNDRVTGATPSSFFAHRTERDQSDSIASDLQYSPASLVIAGYHDAFGAKQDAILNKVKAAGFEVVKGVGNIGTVAKGKRVLCFDNDKPEEQFRLIETAFDESVKYLSADNKNGFFLMVEGAKIDAGGHTNKIKVCIDEYLSFDRVIGKALKFADQDGETLVIITSDHETGGLIVLDGNYKNGTVVGTFTTNDHTGLPVPLLSYGPGAENFTGFIQNADIPKKVMNLLK